MSLPNDNKEQFREAELSRELDVAQAHAGLQGGAPSAGNEPLPVWLVAVFFLIVFWAGAYLFFNSGGFKSDVYDSALVSWSGGGAGKQSGPPDPMIVGKRVFAQNCQLCHQQTGLGVPGQYPPLVGSEWALSEDWHGDNHLIKIVLMGMQGPITVKGQPFNNAMPAWNQLKDEQIAAVLTYVRNEWGNKAPAISVEHVKEIREELKGMGRVDPWSAEELKKFPKQNFTAPAGAPAAPQPAASPAPKA